MIIVQALNMWLIEFKIMIHHRTMEETIRGFLELIELALSKEV